MHVSIPPRNAAGLFSAIASNAAQAKMIREPSGISSRVRPSG